MSSGPLVEVFADREGLTRAAAKRFVRMSADSIALRGRFLVALSGGTTPRDLYALLATSDYSTRVDWAHSIFFWGDERAVPPTDPQSNFRMADQALLSHVPVLRENIHRIYAEEPPPQAAADYDKTLRDFAAGAPLRFDLVLLGLGTNGHTASLFPFTSALKVEDEWCVSVWVTELIAFRITLTATLLNKACSVVFLVSGPDKAGVVADVLRGPRDPERLPAQLIQPQTGELVWLLDSQASAGL